MTNLFSVVEPHPSVPRTGAYIGGGRGGAGNYRRYNHSELTSGPTATGPASRIPGFSSSSSPSPSSSRQQPTATSTRSPRSVSRSTGIGGAGNMFARAETEERVFQFDEELVRRRDAAACTPVYHIGRGGGGNWVDASKSTAQPPPRSERMNSTGSTSSATSSSSSSSTGSDASERNQVRRSIEGAFGRFRDRIAS